MVGRVFDTDVFDNIMSDLEYAKGFKSPEVLFTSMGECIGIGDDGCYIKIKRMGNKITFLRNMILIGKDINQFLNGLKGKIYDKFPFYDNISSLDNPSFPIAKGMNSLVKESIIHDILNFTSSCSYVPEYNIKENEEFMMKMKALKADEGSIPLVIDNHYLVYINKRILQYKSSDSISAKIYDNPMYQFYFINFIVSNKNEEYNTFIKVIRVA
jgi:hypothetical protein